MRSIRDVLIAASWKATEIAEDVRRELSSGKVHPPRKPVAASPLSRTLAVIETICLGGFFLFLVPGMKGFVQIGFTALTLCLVLLLIGRARSNRKGGGWNFLWAFLFLGPGIFALSSAFIVVMLAADSPLLAVAFGFITALPWAVISLLALVGLISEFRSSSTEKLYVAPASDFSEY